MRFYSATGAFSKRCPEPLIRKALLATRDALADRRAGKKGLTSDPGAFFAGAANKLAQEAGIALPVKWKKKA